MTETIAKYETRTPVARLKNIMAQDSVQEQFRNALKDQAPLFVASIIDLFGADSYLQKCDPALVVQECLKAATLRLPLSKSLGFAYIVPYKNKPQFQIGYRGLVQLAIRSGQYRHLNADCVYEGEDVVHDRLTGEVTITGEPVTETAIGYVAYMELVNGFTKSIYWTREQVEAHARRYSMSYGNKNSAWATDFDAMAKKTVLKHLLSHYGVLSIDMMTAWQHEEQPIPAAVMQDEIEAEANQDEIIDMGTGEVQDSEPVQEQAGPAF